jgi:ubiquinone/menaquinone biosynthesis C-methylase UbiE
MGWTLLILALVVVGLAVYWQLVIAEGAYLGRRVVTLLYDWSASGYNRLKGFDAEDEDDFLGRPLAQVLTPEDRTPILDVATGTGRLPLTLLRQPGFAGAVIGLDLSTKMLRIAAQQLVPCRERATLLQAAAAPLPFADERFQVITCLEALEFFDDAPAALDEMVRVLRPGGWLLITNRIGWEARLMPRRTWSRSQLISILRGLPLTDISVRPWQTIYDLVWARKRDFSRREL